VRIELTLNRFADDYQHQLNSATSTNNLKNNDFMNIRSQEQEASTEQYPKFVLYLTFLLSDLPIR